MSSFFRDIRFALRLLGRTPGFTAAAVAVLALGIGVNTAIFSLVHELIWSPRPYPEADRIVQLYSQHKKNPQRFRTFSYPTYRDVASRDGVFAGVLAHTLAMVGVGEGEASRRTFAAIVSSNYFSVLGVPLARGRAFLPEEEKPGSNVPVAIASYLYWKKTGFDPALVGKTIRVDERPFTIVGITPPHFTGTMMLFGPEFYFPLGAFDGLVNDFGSAAHQRTLDRRDAFNLFLVGRLKPGVDRATADAALRTFASHLESAFPVEQKDQTILVDTLPRLGTNTNPQSETPLTSLGTLLLAMAGIVLLVACLNLANLLLARGTARRKEIAVRIALGGGRGRIIRQLLTEGFVLSCAGGAAGLLLAHWSAQLVVRSLASQVPIPIFFRGAANPALLAAALGFCALATLAFALAPALKLTRADVIEDLKIQANDDRAKPHRLRWLPRHPLVVAQIALSLTLLIVAGLFVRGALNASRVETGFHAESTVLAEVDAGLGGHDRTQTLQLYRTIEDRLAALPGVQASAIGAVVPFGMISMDHAVRRAGLTLAPDARPATAEEGRPFRARWNSIGADYFRAMGLPLLRGRAFTSAETADPNGPRIAIVDDVLARELFPGGDALGQRIEFADNDDNDANASRRQQSMEIVGIVPATRWNIAPDENGRAVYVPFAQGFQSNAYFHVRFASLPPGAEEAARDAIRREIRAVSPSVPIFVIKTYPQHLDSSLSLWLIRAGAVMFGLFGGLALLLAVVGLYGVKAYAVSRRTREIGIRLALGAEPRLVRRMILREGLTMTLVGVAIGLLLGAAASRACASLLYEVSAFDPAAFILAPLALAVAALLACWLPARRATKVNPMTALRAE